MKLKQSTVSGIAYWGLLASMVVMMIGSSVTANLLIGMLLFSWTRSNGNSFQPIATHCIEFAAERGSPDAQQLLGALYTGIFGTKQDLNLATKWIEKAALQGDAKAQSNVAGLYMWRAQEDPALFVDAYKWLRKSGDQGSSPCLYFAGQLLFFGQGTPRDLQTAFSQYLQAARYGYDSAQNRIGQFYLFGVGVKPDYRAATHWFELAAKQGMSQSQCFLGANLINGVGTTTNIAEGINWLRKSASCGEMDAQLTLAEINYFGCFKQQDDAQARQLLTAAAKQGSSVAEYLLAKDMFATKPANRLAKVTAQADSHNAAAESLVGNLCAFGIGRKLDWKEANNWYKRAGEHGDADAQCKLGLVNEWGYENGQQNLPEAIKWFEKSASAGNGDAQYQLSQLIQYCLVHDDNQSQGSQWLTRAATKGNTTAQVVLGSMYSKGFGIKQDAVQGMRWLNAAASKGSALAQDSLADAYNLPGSGDKSKATEWHKRAADAGLVQSQLQYGTEAHDARYVKEAADQGNVDAMIKLADCYQQGSPGVEKNVDKCLALYKRAAAMGNTEAQCALGDMYVSGGSVPHDTNTAITWYKMAADKGNSKAIRQLKLLEQGKQPGSNQ